MSEPAYILKLGLQNVRCFGENAELDLSDGNGGWRKWTVIVGDNGLGKTTLLQVLAGSELVVADSDNLSPKFYEIDDWKKKLKFGKSVIRLIYSQNVSSVTGKVIEYILDTTISNIFRKLGLIEDDFNLYSIQHSTIDDDLITRFFCIGYGANRFFSSKNLSEFKSRVSDTLFDDDAKLINAEEWLLQLDYLASKQSDVREFAEKRRELVKETLKGLLLGIDDIHFTTPTKENLQSNVEFKTAFGWTKIQELSFGYKTMIAWVVDLAYRMFERYSDSDKPLAEAAIVLVDEIDLHLHPKWQRKIFEYLSEKFPKTQFVVTAHSPLVVQSAPKDANIVVLRKEGDHVVIDNDVESVQSWRLDQILNSDLFDFIPTRGPDEDDWMKERQTLLQKQTLTEDEQKKLNELNKKANALPSADNMEDMEAMAFIRKAADYLKNKVGVE